MINRLITHLSLATVILVTNVSFGAPTESAPDVVRLKNGSVIRGTIIELITDDVVVIQSSAGSRRTYKMSEVEFAGPSSGSDTKGSNSEDVKRGSKKKDDKNTKDGEGPADEVNVMVTGLESGYSLTLFGSGGGRLKCEDSGECQARPGVVRHFSIWQYDSSNRKLRLEGAVGGKLSQGSRVHVEFDDRESTRFWVGPMLGGALFAAGFITTLWATGPGRINCTTIYPGHESCDTNMPVFALGLGGMGAGLVTFILSRFISDSATITIVPGMNAKSTRAFPERGYWQYPGVESGRGVAGQFTYVF